MAVKLEIKGLDATIKRVEALARNTKDEINAELTAFVNDVAKDAKSNLQRNKTSNTGALANSINADNSVNFSASVTVAKNYGAFVEFGTRKFAAAYVATLPQDWQTYAATFKGGGAGTFDDFVRSIFQWIKERGIKPNPKQFEQGDGSITRRGNYYKPRKKKKVDKEKQLQGLAYVIALKILRDGVRPQPFLYPAIVKNTPLLRERIKNILKGK